MKSCGSTVSVTLPNLMSSTTPRTSNWKPAVTVRPTRPSGARPKRSANRRLTKTSRGLLVSSKGRPANSSTLNVRKNSGLTISMDVGTWASAPSTLAWYITAPSSESTGREFVHATEDTPGIASSASAIGNKVLTSVPTALFAGESVNMTIELISTPRSRRAMFARLCAKTPTIASNAIDSATCTVARAARKEPDAERRSHCNRDRQDRRGDAQAHVGNRFGHARHSARNAERQRRNRQAQQGRRQREHERLGEKQRSEARAARPNRSTYGHLAGSRRGPQQDEPRDVRAAEKQHEGAGRRQQHEAEARGEQYLAVGLPSRAGLEHERSRAKRVELLLGGVDRERRFNLAQDAAKDSAHRGVGL